MSAIRKLFLLAAAFAAVPAAAQLQWYGLAAGGRARTNIDQVRSVEAGFANVSSMQTAFDDADAAWKLSAGLRFNPGLALELTYADLGRTSTRTNGLGGNFNMPYRLAVDRSVRGVGLDAVGTIPLIPSRLDLIGKLGVYRATIRADIALQDEIPGSAPTVRAARDRGREDITHVGLGLQGRVTSRWAIRVEYERYLSVGNPFVVGDPNGTGRSDIDAAWIAVVCSF